MAQKRKASPHRWWKASNLLRAHIVFHIIFVFGYWFSLAARLSFSGSDVIQNHAAVLSDMLTNHLGLLIVLAIHFGAVVFNNWWGQRQDRRANQQFGAIDEHMGAERKLELLLDEVVELREALHEQRVVERADNPDLAGDRLRDHDQVDIDEMISLEDYQALKASKRS